VPGAGPDAVGRPRWVVGVVRPVLEGGTLTSSAAGPRAGFQYDPLSSARVVEGVGVERSRGRGGGGRHAVGS
jgi:hypothetical protein